MDKDGNPTGNRLAKGAKNIVWLEDILPQKKKYFFGKKRKR